MAKGYRYHPYPKMLYRGEEEQRVVKSPEEHLAASKEGWGPPLEQSFAPTPAPVDERGLPEPDVDPVTGEPIINESTPPTTGGKKGGSKKGAK